MRDRSSIWIGLADLLLCIVSVVIVAVAPTHAKTDGIRPKAEYLISADWDVMLDSDVDLWLVNPSRKPIFYGSRQVGCADLDHDSLGFQTSLITLADGSTVRAVSNKEVNWFKALACYRIGVLACFNVMLHRRGKRHDPEWETLVRSAPAMFEHGLELLG